MAYIAHTGPFRRHGAVVAPQSVGRLFAVGELLSRAFNAMLDGIYRSRQRHAEREIERFFRDRGIRMTDSQERELSDRLMGRTQRNRP